MQSKPEESISDELLLKILKIFPPEEFSEIRFGGPYWTILDIMQDLESQEHEFTLADVRQLIRSRKPKKHTKGKLFLLASLPKVFDRLSVNNLIKKGLEGYLLETNVSGALVEFFGSGNRTRRGRIGLVKYMANRTKPAILWYCLCHPSSIQLEALKEFSEHLGQLTQRKVSDCEEWYLTKLAKEGCLKRVSATEFRLVNEKKTFDELISKYKVFIQPGPLLRDFIQLIIEQHSAVSGKMIHEELDEMKISHHPTSVYKEIKSLVVDKILIDRGKTRKAERGHGTLKFYDVNFGDPAKYKEESIKAIEQSMKHYGFSISSKDWKRFSQFAKKQKPNELEVFQRELRWGFLLRNIDQTTSIPLWLSFLKEFQTRELIDHVKRVVMIDAVQSHISELEAISREYKTSPLVIALFYNAIAALL